ncbi:MULTISPECIES: exonuclease domain-containing protein [Nocardia]|uniref:exonuclease domain-containing protein n=1 Tax=Nocardia TaxID=1817 RepID=UPI000D68E7CA|nr:MULTISPECIES: exonuclease domain-containing protein [Nocardia]
MIWSQMPLAAFDLETTGPDPRDARVVTAYIGVINGSAKIEHHWLLDPGIEIPAGATAVHGISTEKARAEGLDYRTGMIQIQATLDTLWGQGRIVAAYNGCYDLTVLAHEAARLQLDSKPVGPMVDPFVLDRHVDPHRQGKRKLVDVATVYGVKMGAAHTADADALAAARLAWVMARRFPEIGQLDVAQLMSLQAQCYAERSQQLRAMLEDIATKKQERAHSMLEDARGLLVRAAGISELWPVQ